MHLDIRTLGGRKKWSSPCTFSTVLRDHGAVQTQQQTISVKDTQPETASPDGLVVITRVGTHPIGNGFDEGG
jgi:hypothetical protein